MTQTFSAPEWECPLRAEAQGCTGRTEVAASRVFDLAGEK